MAIVPLQKKEFDILDRIECIGPVFRSLGFREPQQGENYWRIPDYLKSSEAEIYIDRIKNSISTAVEQQSDPENFE